MVKMMKAAICVMVVLAMVQYMVKPGEAVSCAEVDSSLVQCMPFLTGTSASPVEACCNGIKHLKQVVVTTPDKRQACNCVKQAASHYENIKDDAVSSLPTKCGTPLSFPISKDFNCDSIPRALRT